MKTNAKKKDGEQPSEPSPEAYAKEKKGYAVKVNDSNLTFHDPIVTGKEILNQAGFDPLECYQLYQKFKDCDFERISPEEKVDLSKPGPERFLVKPTDIFHYTVDNDPETSEVKFMTANGILTATGLEPTDYYLVEILPNNKQKSYKDHPNEPIELKCPGLKFISVFKGATPVS